MEAIKRVEIITESLQIKRICKVLDDLGVSGYTVFGDVTGKGDRGVQSGDELTGVFKNGCILTTCEPERLSQIVEAIRPILTRRGGVCLVSDAQWVIH